MTADILLSQAIDGFLIARAADGYSSATLDQYRWALKMLLEQGDISFNQVSSEHLRRFMAAIQAKPTLSATSVFHVWKAIHALYKWSFAEGLTGRPDKALTKPKHAYREIQPLSQEEIKALLKAAERTKPSEEGRRKSFTMSRPTALRDKAVILLLLDTGIRAGELCRLTVQDIDLQNGAITILPYRSGLKSRPRVAPVGQMTRKAMWRYQTSRNTEYDLFFCGLSRNGLLQLTHRLGQRAGVKRVHPHRFRHTFAIQYLRNGGDVFTLQRILGHSSLEMVRHYLALAQVDDQNAHRKAGPVDRWNL